MKRRLAFTLAIAAISIALNVYVANTTSIFPWLNWIMVGVVIGTNIMVIIRMWEHR